MSELVEIASVNDFKSRNMQMVNIRGHEYLIAKIQDKYYATDNLVPIWEVIFPRGHLIAAWELAPDIIRNLILSTVTL